MGEGSSAQPQWHLSREGKQYGPFSTPELFRMAELGQLQVDDLLWKPGYEAWKPVSAVPGILTPPVPQPAPAHNNSAGTALPIEAEGFSAAPGQAPALSNTTLATPKRRFDAFQHLWRGQLPLGEAFWLFGIVGSLVSVLTAATIAAGIAAIFNYVGLVSGAIFFVLVLPFLGALIYQAFVFVGIWRAASGRGFWGILARTYIVFAVSLFVLKLGSLVYVLTNE
ncbi:MAG: DUF4339 domain-containing protein [Phycisphaeraceae bacterium]